MKATNWPSNALDSSFMQVLLAAVWGKTSIFRSRCRSRGSGQGRAMVITVAASFFPLTEATLRMRLSVPPLGMPSTAPTSGLHDLSLPGLGLLAAWGRKGAGGALTGCGQELLQLKLERPEKGKEEEIKGLLASSCLPLQARERLSPWVRKDPSS